MTQYKTVFEECETFTLPSSFQGLWNILTNGFEMFMTLVRSYPFKAVKVLPNRKSDKWLQYQDADAADIFVRWKMSVLKRIHQKTGQVFHKTTASNYR